MLYGEIRRHIGEIIRELARQKESLVVEGHLMPDHLHVLMAIPPKYSVSQVVGFIKGKSAIHIARSFVGRKKNFIGQNFWARGYYVSTTERAEKVIREYIRKREEEDRKFDQLNIFE